MMKKTLAALLGLCLLLTVLCGCAGKKDGAADAQALLKLFKRPAEVVEIDMTKKDPTTDAMRFVYDEEGRVFLCYYEIEGHEVYVHYGYKDDSVQIFAFIDNDIVVDDETIELPSKFDANGGFSVIEGYYFKGFTA